MAETLAKLGAARYFVENPSATTVLATADGNVFQAGRMSFAKHHASGLVDKQVFEYERGDLEDEMEEVEEDIQVNAALTLTRRAVLSFRREMEAAPREPVTDEGAKEQLVELLDVEAFDDVPHAYSKGETVVPKADAIIATWFASGLSVATWNEKQLADRQAAVNAAFDGWEEEEAPEI